MSFSLARKWRNATTQAGNQKLIGQNLLSFSKRVENQTEVPALILGNGLSALGAMRSLAACGIRCINVSRTTSFEAFSRYYCAASNTIDENEDLFQFLINLPLKKAVLFPCSDNWVLQVSNLPQEIRERFPTFVVAKDIIARFTDKAEFARILEDLDVPRPDTYINSVDKLRETNSEYFIKPVDSQKFMQAFQTKGFFCENRERLVEKFKSVSSAGFACILQEFIPGPASQHYYLEGYFEKNGEFDCIFARRRLRIWPPRLGNSTAMVSIGLTELQTEIQHLRRLFRYASFSGIFSAEYKFDSRDSKYKLLEINVRPWWFVEFASRCGMQVTYCAFRRALGFPVEPQVGYKVGAQMIDFYTDFHACFNMLRSKKLSIGTWLNSWRCAESCVFTWKDPWPAIRKSTNLVKAFIRNKLWH